MTDTQALLDFILTLDRLKAVERRTSPSGMSRRENSAEHSWHGGVCALLLQALCAFPVNASHAALLMLVHDIPEIECGDTFAYAAEHATAHQAEALALRHLTASLPAQNAETLRALWAEFTAGETPEARYANALDRLMPVLHNLASAGRVWHAHGVTLEQVLARTQHIGEVFPALWARIRPGIEAVFEGASHE